MLHPRSGSPPNYHAAMMLIILTLTMLMMGTAIPVPEPAATCESGYSECASRGAFTLFDDFVHLYQNLVETVDASDHFKREPLNAEVIPPRAAATLLCCAQGMQCLALKDRDVPFCWDRFTTNVYLPDGSYGSITTGDFVLASGEKVNLLTGQFANGSNIYTADMTAIPNLTMSLPRPWTSSGVGSAIPASVLGASAIDRTTIASSNAKPSNGQVYTNISPGATSESGGGRIRPPKPIHFTERKPVVTPKFASPTRSDKTTTLKPTTFTQIILAVSSTSTGVVTSRGKLKSAKPSAGTTPGNTLTTLTSTAVISSNKISPSSPIPITETAPGPTPTSTGTVTSSRKIRTPKFVVYPGKTPGVTSTFADTATNPERTGSLKPIDSTETIPDVTLTSHGAVVSSHKVMSAKPTESPRKKVLGASLTPDGIVTSSMISTKTISGASLMSAGAVTISDKTKSRQPMLSIETTPGATRILAGIKISSDRSKQPELTRPRETTRGASPTPAGVTTSSDRSKPPESPGLAETTLKTTRTPAGVAMIPGRLKRPEPVGFMESTLGASAMTGGGRTRLPHPLHLTETTTVNIAETITQTLTVDSSMPSQTTPKNNPGPTVPGLPGLKLKMDSYWFFALVFTALIISITVAQERSL